MAEPLRSYEERTPKSLRTFDNKIPSLCVRLTTKSKTLESCRRNPKRFKSVLSPCFTIGDHQSKVCNHVPFSAEAAMSRSPAAFSTRVQNEPIFSMSSNHQNGTGETFHQRDEMTALQCSALV